MRRARTFFWSRVAVWGLVLSTAALAVVGVCAMFLDLPPDWAVLVRGVCVVAFAAVAGFSLGVAQVAAAAAQVLQNRPEHKRAFKFAIFCAVLTGGVSLAGVHLGWSLLIGRPDQIPPMWAVDIAGFGLAFVKIAMSFVIEACQAVDHAEIARAEAADQARLDAIAAEERAVRRARMDAPSPPPAPRRNTALKVVSGAAMGLALMNAGAQAQAVPQTVRETTDPTTTAQSTGPVTLEMRAHAKRLIAQGLNAAEAHRISGVPYTTTKRYAQEWRAQAA